jgi:hypothetical protein
MELAQDVLGNERTRIWLDAGRRRVMAWSAQVESAPLAQAAQQPMTSMAFI